MAAESGAAHYPPMEAANQQPGYGVGTAGEVAPTGDIRPLFDVESTRIFNDARDQSARRAAEIDEVAGRNQAWLDEQPDLTQEQRVYGAAYNQALEESGGREYAAARPGDEQANLFQGAAEARGEAAAAGHRAVIDAEVERKRKEDFARSIDAEHMSDAEFQARMDQAVAGGRELGDLQWGDSAIPARELQTELNQGQLDDLDRAFVAARDSDNWDDFDGKFNDLSEAQRGQYTAHRDQADADLERVRQAFDPAPAPASSNTYPFFGPAGAPASRDPHDRGRSMAVAVSGRRRAAPPAWAAGTPPSGVPPVPPPPAPPAAGSRPDLVLSWDSPEPPPDRPTTPVWPSPVPFPSGGRYPSEPLTRLPGRDYDGAPPPPPPPPAAPAPAEERPTPRRRAPGEDDLDETDLEREQRLRDLYETNPEAYWAELGLGQMEVPRGFRWTGPLGRLAMRGLTGLSRAGFAPLPEGEFMTADDPQLAPYFGQPTRSYRGQPIRGHRAAPRTAVGRLWNELRTNRYAGELNLPNYQDDPDTVVVGSPGGSTYLSPEQAAAQPQTRDRGFEQLMAENPRNDDESLEAYTQRLAEADAKRRGQPRLRVPNPRAANRPGYPDRLQDFEDEFYYTNGYYPTF